MLAVLGYFAGYLVLLPAQLLLFLLAWGAMSASTDATNWLIGLSEQERRPIALLLGLTALVLVVAVIPFVKRKSPPTALGLAVFVAVHGAAGGYFMLR